MSIRVGNAVSFDQHRFLAAFNGVQQCRSTAFELSADQLHWFETVPSTNQVAWEWLDQTPLLEPIVIAESQTAGRGQWGRQWQSEPGGLYLSVGLNHPFPVERSAQLTLCTVWGIAIALRTIPGILSGVDEGIPVQIKWLNDLVLNGYKLGGILTETRVQHGQISKAVIGVGINWSNPTPATGINLQAFLEQQPVPLIESLEMLAAITLHGLWSGISQWQQSGIEPILAAYLDLLAHRDRPVLVKGQAGTIVGIAPTGELQVRLSSITNPEVTQPVTTTEIWAQPGTINLDYPV